MTGVGTGKADRNAAAHFFWSHSGPRAETITYNDRYCITIKKPGKTGPQERKIKTRTHAANPLNLQKIHKLDLQKQIRLYNPVSEHYIQFFLYTSWAKTILRMHKKFTMNIHNMSKDFNAIMRCLRLCFWAPIRHGLSLNVGGARRYFSLSFIIVVQWTIFKDQGKFDYLLYDTFKRSHENRHLTRDTNGARSDAPLPPTLFLCVLMLFL